VLQVSPAFGAADEDDGEEGDVADLPETGLPPVKSESGKKRGRRPMPENLPRERVEYDLPDDQKACPHRCSKGDLTGHSCCMNFGAAKVDTAVAQERHPDR
jgi:hypothetical protein